MRWRKTYVPGPTGLDDAVQVVVQIFDDPMSPFAGTTRTYTYLRDELGTVMGLVAEEEGSDPAHPPMPARYLYTPYGEAHAETGPEPRRAWFDEATTRVVPAAGGTAVTQAVADPNVAAAGALRVRLSLPLEAGTVAAGGVVVEERSAGAGWTAVDPAETVVGPPVTSGGEVSTEGSGGEVAVLLRGGWERGVAYRVRLTTALRDEAGRSLAEELRLEWTVASDPAGGVVGAGFFERQFAPAYESWQAAGESAGGRFVGGQTALFEGLWTDPVSGIAYARARWYDARNASWLSEDPLQDVDSPNLYAFVGWRPNMGSDPLGLACQEEEDVRWYSVGGSPPAGPSIGPCTPTIGTRIGDLVDHITGTSRFDKLGPGSSHTVGEFRTAIALQILAELWGVAAAASEAAEAVEVAEAAPEVGKRLSLSYRQNRIALRGSGTQANHLNQSAAFDVIPKSEGASTGMRGNAFTEPGTPHYAFHEDLEKFWTPFRKGGARYGQTPTNAEYGEALEEALKKGEFSAAEAKQLAEEAAEERVKYGLQESDPVPRVPGRINQKKP